jgi:hypothetical protein
VATSKKNVSGSARATIDHDEIREWVESHGGTPAHVQSTGRGKSAGILRIDFPGFSGEGSLEPLEWDEFFERFEEAQLAFLYQDKTASGRPSNFNKLVKRDSVELSPARGRSSTRSKSGTRKKASSRSATPGARGASGGRRATKSRASKKKTAKRSSGSARGTAARSSTARGAKASTARRGTAGSRSKRSAAGKTARAPSQREAPKRVAKKKAPAGGARRTSKKSKRGK